MKVIAFEIKDIDVKWKEHCFKFSIESLFTLNNSIFHSTEQSNMFNMYIYFPNHITVFILKSRGLRGNLETLHLINKCMYR